MKQFIKWMIYPGMNLHARDRFDRIPQKFGEELGPGKHVLDAGCGNGMLSYRAWQRGANVLGISIKQNEVDQCRDLFNRQQNISEDRLKFQNINLYDLDPKDATFDTIICTEVLEHIVNDKGICEKFFQLLKPGGVVHITTPNAEHPYNIAFPIDEHEKGGHVRPGYTEGSYRTLLEPIGFQVEDVTGLGGPIRQYFDDRIKTAQESYGRVSGIPLFLLAMPLLWLDSSTPNVPFCLYVKARKPVQN
jgi:SAM-dependent methyltransferase